MKIKFTQKAIEAIPLPTSGRTVIHDEVVPGLILRITPAGVRTYQVYKKVGGSPLRVTIGRYESLGIEAARKEAKQLIAKMAVGENPNTEKKVERTRALSLDELIKQYVETRTLKASTVEDMRRAFEQVIPDWRTKPINKISSAMIQQRHKDHGKRSMARSNLAMRYLRALFNFAQAQFKDDEGKPIVAINPVDILSELKAWHRVDRRRTVIGPESLGPWVNAVLSLPNPGHKAYYLFVLMTGCRRSEAMNLLWEDVSLTQKTVTFRDTKNHSDHTLPLSDYACKMLSELQKAKPEETDSQNQKEEVKPTGPVFADRSGKKISNLRTTQAFVTAESGVPFCIHDLRRTFATIAESLDVPAYALKRMLNHADAGDVTSGYLIINSERMRDPIQRVCDFILRSAGIQEPAKVIPFKGKTANDG